MAAKSYLSPQTLFFYFIFSGLRIASSYKSPKVTVYLHDALDAASDLSI